MIILYLLYIFILFYINADHYIFIRILLGPNIYFMAANSSTYKNKQKGKYHVAVTSKKAPFY